MTTTNQDEMTLIAKTVFGLEEVLAGELRRIGARDVEILNRAVKFTGDKGMIYKSNLSLRTALRILVPIAQFEVSDEKSLYDGIAAIDWETYMDVDGTLAIDTVLSTDIFNHSQFISQKAKDAIVDQFRAKHDKRPDVDLERPTLRINLHIHDTTCSVALDSSGDSLHKRGYRDQTNLAPINEVLAAGLVLLTNWDRKKPLIDPMCGSGTILIEAALIAANIPPGYYRVDFGFMHWKKFLPFDEELWQTIYDAAISRIISETPPVLGGEISHHVTRKAKENVKLARVEDIVQIKECNMNDFEAPEGGGIVIINPPYGERMDKDNLEELYASIGDTFKKRFTGYDCWMITSNMQALKFVGLRASRKIQVFNGQLECRFVKYEMYRGTKKIHKLREKEQ
ncbi:MAG TPA: THUMP domain-containing protein [Bacteroidia bacterium]|nr:THUMP domain-containing protein [Bacteroidia bacterium]